MFTSDETGNNKMAGFLKGTLFLREKSAGETPDQVEMRLDMLSEGLTARLPQRGYIRL